MLVRGCPELVRGVRDQLALLLLGLVERREHRVEARAEACELVVPLEADPMREVARLGDDLGLARELRHGPKGGSCDERAEGGRGGDAAQRDEDEDDPNPVEQAVDLLERTNELEGVPVPDGHDELEHVCALDHRVREERIASLCRGLRHLVRDGERHLPRIRLRDRALCVDRLDEDVALREAAVRRLEHP